MIIFKMGIGIKKNETDDINFLIYAIILSMQLFLLKETSIAYLFCTREEKGTRHVTVTNKHTIVFIHEKVLLQ